jgi:hypothetical protein
MPLPQAIDGVIRRLDEIVLASIAEPSRVGYFAALYNRVTVAVRLGIRAGAFDDNARMERLDVVFANRYIDAFERHRAGQPTTLSWQVAFAAAARHDMSVLQHLLLGMNAHINLDLGIACAAVAPGATIHALERDFLRINGVLASLMPTVGAQLGELSPSFDLLTGVAQDLDQLDVRVGNFSMGAARRSAWRFALVLAGLGSPIAQRVAIKARDAETLAFAAGLQQPGALSIVSGGTDQSNIAVHMQVLARGLAGLAGA